MRARELKVRIVTLTDKDLDPPQGGKWVLIEEDESGLWFGTGFGYSEANGETLYISERDSDQSYPAAVLSASNWARRNEVDTIYVRRL